MNAKGRKYNNLCRSVTDPRSGKRVALKKMPNVFQNLASCKRVYREIRMLDSFKHDNVSAFHLADRIPSRARARSCSSLFPLVTVEAPVRGGHA